MLDRKATATLLENLAPAKVSLGGMRRIRAFPAGAGAFQQGVWAQDFSVFFRTCAVHLPGFVLCLGNKRPSTEVPVVSQRWLRG